MLVQGATAYMSFTLKDQNDTPIDLTNAIVKLLFRRNEFETPITRPCSTQDQPAGVCVVTLTPDDLNDGGTYYYQLKVSFPDNTVMKSALASFYVEEGLQEV